MISIVVLGEVKLNGGEVLFGVEIENEIFEGEHFFANNEPLPFVDPAELACIYLTSPRQDRAGAEVFDKKKTLEAEGHDRMFVV